MPGGHAQTIYPFLLPRPKVRYRRERVETADADFWDFDWLDADPAPTSRGEARRHGATAPDSSGATDEAAAAHRLERDAVDDMPLVVLFHGLEGGSGSHYARALMARLAAIGWRGIIPHFRGCGGELNRQPRAYHSGDFEEIGALLEAIRERAPQAPMVAVGISLGGSALLNWLGRSGPAAAQILQAAAAVSAPLDLTAAGIAIGQGFNRVYTRHFLWTLKPKGLAMARRHPGLFDPARIRRVRSMYEFDDVVTAPLHGFTGTADYWSRASSMPWLDRIAIPTLVLNARNDPFVPAASLPGIAQVSPEVLLEQPPTGGHVGFPTGPFPGRLEWLPRRLLQFFQDGI